MQSAVSLPFTPMTNAGGEEEKRQDGEAQPSPAARPNTSARDEEHELQRCRARHEKAQEELKLRIAQLTSIMGESFWKQIEDDPDFQDVSTPTFARKYLSNEAPGVREIAQLRIKVHELAVEVARFQTRHEARHMSTLDLWEHIQELREENQVLRQRLDRALSGTADNWNPHLECVSDAPLKLVDERNPHRTWNASCTYAVLASNWARSSFPPSQWIWNLNENSLQELRVPCFPRSQTSLLWHPTEEALLGVLYAAPNPQNCQQEGPVFARVWNTVDCAWVDDGYPIGGATNGATLVGWRDDQLIARQGGKVWVGPSLACDCKDQPCPHEGGISPCGRFHLFFTGGGNRKCCVYSLDTQSYVYECAMPNGHDMMPHWDTNSNLLLSCETDIGDGKQWYRHLFFSTSEQRVTREWRDMFPVRGFILAPTYGVTSDHRLWNTLDAGGVAMNLADADLPRHVVPPRLPWKSVHESGFALGCVSPNGTHRIDIDGHCLRVWTISH